MADPGEGPGGPAPLIFRPNCGPKVKKIFLETGDPEHAIALVQLNGFLSLLAKKLVF